jgi:hypothetical protein
MLGELHQGMLADLLTKELGWDWDERSRRHSNQVRWEVTGVSENLLSEFSQRGAAIEERKEVLIPGASRPPPRSSNCASTPPSKPGRAKSTAHLA